MNIYNQDNIIILRSVYGKGGLKTSIKYYITPCIDPKTGRFPKCVRKIDSQGDMILSDEDKNNLEYLIAEDRVFILEDGATFNLDDPHSRAEWEAIEHCKLISPSRDAKDSSGRLKIDGEDTRHTKSYNSLQNARYGTAELYIERPGEDTVKRISKRKIKNTAENFIFNDDHEGLILKARLMGRSMKNQPLADIQDYLMEIAERNPTRIINLYTGEDMHLRLLLIDALEKHVIIVKNKLYVYSDNVVLGASEDAVITWMKQPTNSKILELIKKESHPELYNVLDKDAKKRIEELEKAKVSK